MTTKKKTASLRQVSESSIDTANDSDAPTKPLRPLSAYHVFFQLEREYILQSVSNDGADKSSQEQKMLLKNAPKRYAGIKMFPDWHARPGKRQRRKHRKTHGHIGFQELSKTISKRWAEIDKTDPGVKSFVQNIANAELEEYQQDIKLYKELTKHLSQESEKVEKAVTPKRPSPRSSPSFCLSPSLVSQDSKIPEESNQEAVAALLLMQVSADKCEGDLIACDVCSKDYRAECLNPDVHDIPTQWHCSPFSSSPQKKNANPFERRKSSGQGNV